MYIKEVIFCAAVLFVQTISGQYRCQTNQLAEAYNIPCGCQPNQPYSIPAPTCGGYNTYVAPSCGCQNTRYTPYAVSLTVSPCPLPGAPNIPAGMSIASDNLLISGPVLAAGKLPFSGAVALEGALPACGAGCVQYGCGDVVVLTEVPMGIDAMGYGGGCRCGRF